VLGALVACGQRDQQRAVEAVRGVELIRVGAVEGTDPQPSRAQAT
jgi:hypothetical protein